MVTQKRPLRVSAPAARPAASSHERSGERGQILPLLAFGIVALLTMVALVADVGYWRYQQRLEQSAADSGAMAGAIALYYPTVTPSCPPSTVPAEVTTAAQKAAQAVGFTDGASNVTVAVSNTPPAPSRTGATPYPCNTAVEVIVTKRQPPFFAGIVGKNNGTMVKSRAVAQIKKDTAICLYQLDSTDGISASVDAVNCGVAGNGNLANGSYSAETTALDYYATPAPTGRGVATSNVYHLLQPVADPCYKIPGCAYLKAQTIPSSAGATSAANATTLTAPAEPGYLVVTNCCSKGVTFGPGLYYIYGGISGRITGTNVTLVNVDGAMNGHGAGSSIDVSAPPTYDTVTWPTGGVAFYQPASNATDETLNGAVNPAIFNGLYYAPSQHITTHGKDFTMAMGVIGGISISGKTLTVNPVIGGLSQLIGSQYPTHVMLSE